jgi:lysophospholipase L1-like esterase
MLYKNVHLHNFEEAAPLPGASTVVLERIPREVSSRLRESTKFQFQRAGCSEIRFVSDGGSPATITLSSLDGPSTAYVYYGDFPCRQYQLDETPLPIRIEPQHPWLLTHDQVRLGELPFSTKVWRILLHGSRICLHDIEGEAIRPPKPDETPGLTYLAYGTSITFGEYASAPDVTYVKQAAWHMGMDVLNLGAAGSAHCEPELADYIADRKDWDVASLCVSINMLNQGVSLQEYADKAAYMAHTIAGRHPGKPVICIGLFPSFADFGIAWPERHPVSTAQEYRDALKQIVESSGLKNLYYLDGRSLLSRYNGLSHDMLHPNNQGMIEIGRGLSDFIRSVLP